MGKKKTARVARKPPQKRCGSCNKQVHTRTKQCPHCGELTNGSVSRNGHGHGLASKELSETLDFVRRCGGITRAATRIQNLHRLQQDLNAIAK
jgi:predicted RNA-binding Zn-ribbon protein involved in translation (DUF1610 family)